MQHNHTKVSLRDYLAIRRKEFYQQFNYEFFQTKSMLLLTTLSNQEDCEEILKRKQEYGDLKVESRSIDMSVVIRDTEMELYMTR